MTIRLTPIDAAINGQSDIYMRLANINMTSESFRAFLSDCIRKLAAYEDLGTVDELTELVAAKQDNRLVVLPCKVGDNIYWINDEENCVSVQKNGIRGILVRKDGFAIEDTDGYIDISGTKYCYLTREAAEAALKEQTNGTP